LVLFALKAAFTVRSEIGLWKQYRPSEAEMPEKKEREQNET
jgi:hypothetical protein